MIGCRRPGRAILATALLALSSPGLAQQAMPVSLPPFCNAKTPEQVATMTMRPLACGFDRVTMRYAGAPVAQARCLLRQVGQGGRIAPELPLPATLEALVGATMTVPRDRFMRYLAANGISPGDLGGDLAMPLARTEEGRAAEYFVIHDTSTPNFGLAPFPPDIDMPGWDYNRLDRQRAGIGARAHLYIARTGYSVTAMDFAMPWRATKTESCVLLARGKGLFLHVELVEPRRSDPAGPFGNDGLAPAAPFQAVTDAQLDRLALAYIAASIRAGHWLVPAFHATIDEGIGDSHDDPQGFRLGDWAARIDRVVVAVTTGVAPGGGTPGPGYASSRDAAMGADALRRAIGALLAQPMR